MSEHLKDCDCKDWAKFTRQLEDLFKVCAIHGAGGYRGKQFRYCPWCGKKRETEEKANSK